MSMEQSMQCKQYVLFNHWFFFFELKKTLKSAIVLFWSLARIKENNEAPLKCQTNSRKSLQLTFKNSCAPFFLAFYVSCCHALIPIQLKDGNDLWGKALFHLDVVYCVFPSFPIFATKKEQGQMRKRHNCQKLYPKINSAQGKIVF